MSMSMGGSKARKASVVERLRSLADAEVVVSTAAGSFTGTVLSCTRLSVWLVDHDEDVMVAVADIVDVAPARPVLSATA